MDKHFAISVAPMGDDRFATIFFDITEQKRTQQATQQAKEAAARAERHYRLMFNSVSDAVFVHKFGEDGLPSHFLEVNDNACRLLGYTREELMQMRVTDIIAPEEHFNASTNAKRLLAEGHVNWEGRLAAVDSRRIPVEVSARIFDLGGSPTIISSVRDISERKQAEAALRESEEGHRSIVQTAMEGFWLTNSEGRLLEVNETYCRMSGYSAEELLTMCISDLVDNQTADETAIRLKRLMSQREARFESRHRRKDGSTFAVEASVQYRPVNGGRFVCFLRDITERRRAEGEKVKLQDQLRQAQKLESVGRLAGGVAHDFNNLLTVINGYSGMLLEQLKVFDPLHPYALEIKNAGERAASLTKQLLAFSRKQIIEPTVFDLNTTIRKSAPMLQRLIGEDIALETHLADSLEQVFADPDQIHQVIMNLAVNARDAMPDGGRLEIGTTNIEFGAEASTAKHPDWLPGRYVVMSVTDSGHGMDETTRQQIFEPFFTTKEVGKGTGLGLATVHGIIRQNGGWVEVSSEVGVGTSFEVYLPRLDACPLPEESRIGVATERGNETILLVEDQKSVRSFAGAALKEYGYHVIEASDGDEAIAVAAEYAGDIHLLLTDVVMPGISGKESSERMKEVRPNLKVLFMSGYTADVIAQRGVLDRSVAFLHKPFSPVELAAKVREVLAQSS
jgi:PAS domain S-box-containing protein